MIYGVFILKISAKKRFLHNCYSTNFLKKTYFIFEICLSLTILKRSSYSTRLPPATAKQMLCLVSFLPEQTNANGRYSY